MKIKDLNSWLEDIDLPPWDADPIIQNKNILIEPKFDSNGAFTDFLVAILSDQGLIEAVFKLFSRIT